MRRGVLCLVVALPIMVHAGTGAGTGALQATAAGSANAASATPLVIYDNQVESPWIDGSFSYSSRTPCDTSIYHSPPCSYAITLESWGALDVHYPTATFSTAPYQNLDYYLQPNGQPLSDFGIIMTTRSGRLITDHTLSATDNLGTTANGFDHISIPLSTLNPDNKPLWGIQLKNELNASLATIHVDDVVLTSAGGTATATTTPVLSTNTAVPPASTATNTPEQATSTPTNTPLQATSTPTSTPVQATSTPTNTPVQATNTPAQPTSTPTSTASGGSLPGLHVAGTQLLTANNQPVVLRGVNRSGTEYACIQGWGIFDGPSDAASIQAMQTWGINGVNIGLNEDCWLGINGVPAQYGGSTYQQAIVRYTKLLESYGMYPVISLFWEAPGTQQATGQIAMPDADHATALWQSVANTFKGDPDVILRLKEEPYPAGNSDSTAAWQCWLTGGSACSEGYPVVGMQALINTIRATGATNVIQVPGIQYANTMDQFLTYLPSDPLHNLMGVVDVYPNGNICGNDSCYNSEYAPVIARLPFMAGEFGESVNGDVCSVSASNDFMNWMDQHHSGYFAWVWDTWGTSCGDLSLILSYDGTPKSPNGTNYKSHLLALLNG
jgi:hypothetical protein